MVAQKQVRPVAGVAKIAWQNNPDYFPQLAQQVEAKVAQAVQQSRTAGVNTALQREAMQLITKLEEEATAAGVYNQYADVISDADRTIWALKTRMAAKEQAGQRRSARLVQQKASAGGRAF